MNFGKILLIQKGVFIGAHLDEAIAIVTSSAYASIKRKVAQHIQVRRIRDGSKKFEPIMPALKKACATLNKRFQYHKAAVFKIDETTSLVLQPPRTSRIYFLITGCATISYKKRMLSYRKVLKPGDCFVYEGGATVKASFEKGSFVIGLKSLS